MLDGRPEDVVSIASACNRICRLAGVHHHVVDVEPSDDPELAAVFGPTLMAIADQGGGRRARRGEPLTETKTYKRLGYDPISLDEGLGLTVEWLREIGRLGTA